MNETYQDLEPVEPVEEQPEEEIEFEMEYTSPSEYIQAAYFAMSSVDDIDMEIIPSEAEKRRIKRIRWKSIKMIDEALDMMYKDLFGDDDD